jgi:hypothetical protein
MENKVDKVRKLHFKLSFGGLLSFIMLSLFMGCSDPGEVYINVEKNGKKSVIKVNEPDDWVIDDGAWFSHGEYGRRGYRPADPTAAKAIEKYMKSQE